MISFKIEYIRWMFGNNFPLIVDKCKVLNFERSHNLDFNYNYLIKMRFKFNLAISFKEFENLIFRRSKNQELNLDYRCFNSN